MQKEPSNFSNPHAKLKTVSDRVESKLKAAIVAVCQLPAASISNDLADRVEQFCKNILLPVLDRYAVQGEHRDLITTLNRVISERCPAQTATA